MGGRRVRVHSVKVWIRGLRRAYLRQIHQAEPITRARLPPRVAKKFMVIVSFGFQVSAHMRSRLWYTPVRAVVASASPWRWRKSSRFMSSS